MSGVMVGLTVVVHPKKGLVLAGRRSRSIIAARRVWARTPEDEITSQPIRQDTLDHPPDCEKSTREDEGSGPEC